ncbi:MULTISPECIES: sugar ABC transporter permease [unclassified Arthrobacter]|jgi:multiple sugar transport system permease protein|uniref:carbohydrate ABC transporter permease n=1 Tax=unclassified Arthrobacter TaxID=235627 RepID=UPI0009A6DA7F|nr:MULTISPECIES: sugar ABC transporter permease [unclassified Arthrobacter]MDF2051425.1 sugar ABC transporter permease [Arthrobacter sp. Cr_A7]SLK00211.1 carbohydrate ABC transporter membrane protein 1, CUT1 family [Arthrobacter sp. P2b]
MTVQAPPAPAKAATPVRRRSVPAAVWLIGPSVVFMTLLLGWPVIEGVMQAFRNEQGFTLEFVTRMVQDPYFWPAVRNTLLLIAVMIPIQFAFAIGMALLLRANPRLNKVHFFIWAIPLALSDLAAGLVWLSIFNDRGYLNSALAWLGIEGVSWLAYDNQTTMFICVLIAELWRATSLVLVIVVAGLQGIPKDYDEAAQVFGASFWQRLRHVTLPLLKPSLQVALILRTILAFQTFAVAQALTGQNFPLVVGETYRWYTGLQNPNVAAALALVILAVSMLTSIFYLRALREKTQGGTR